ncbi:hypothetical protein [Sinomicrobium sp. M5D2P9]
MKIIKIVLFLFAVVILSYTGYEYYQYASLQKFIKNYKEAEEGFSVFTKIGSMHDQFGEVWPANKTQLDTMLQEIGRYKRTDKLFLEKYGYNLQIDTVTVDTDTLKYTNIEYTLYSYGPDKKDDSLRNLPLNTIPFEFNMSGASIKAITFWDYLFLNKKFDIVLVTAISEFNCEAKKYRYVDAVEREDKAFYLGRNMITEGSVNGESYEERSRKWEALDKKFSQTLKTIQENLTEQYPDTPTEGLIFNYNGKHVRCICSFNVPDAPVTTIEKILTEKLNVTANYIGMTAFYMEVPVLQ